MHRSKEDADGQELLEKLAEVTRSIDRQCAELVALAKKTGLKPTVGEPDVGPGKTPGNKPQTFEPEAPTPQNPFPQAGRDPHRHDVVPTREAATGMPAAEPATAAQQRIMLRTAAQVLSSYVPRPEDDLEEMLRGEVKDQMRRGLGFLNALERAKQEVAARIRSGLA